MSSTPVTPTPAPTNSTIVTAVTKDWTWFTQHILILAFVALLLLGGVYFVDNVVSKHDAANASKYEAILNTQIAQTKTLQQQLAADETAAAQRDAQYQATIASLAKSISTRDANAKQQQQKDANLNTVDAAARLSQQLNAAPNGVTTNGDAVILDLPTARLDVSALDALTNVRGDYADAQKQLTAQSALTADANKQLVDAQAIIVSQDATIKDETKVCNSQISAIKAKQRKTLIKVGAIAYVAGVITGVTAHLW